METPRVDTPEMPESARISRSGQLKLEVAKRDPTAAERIEILSSAFGTAMAELYLENGASGLNSGLEFITNLNSALIQNDHDTNDKIRTMLATQAEILGLFAERLKAKKRHTTELDRQQMEEPTPASSLEDERDTRIFREKDIPN